MATTPAVVAAMVVVMVAAAAMAPEVATAQNSWQDFVDLHNAARLASGVTEEVHWDGNVAAYAEWYAGQRSGDCARQHSPEPRSYGENIYQGPPGVDWTAADAVNLWANEKQFYDYNSNSCTDGQMCGHYTQVVWRASTAIGCARVVCDTGGVFITCNYWPPGNVDDQRPFDSPTITAAAAAASTTRTAAAALLKVIESE